MLWELEFQCRYGNKHEHYAGNQLKIWFLFFHRFQGETNIILHKILEKHHFRDHFLSIFGPHFHIFFQKPDSVLQNLALVSNKIIISCSLRRDSYERDVYFKSDKLSVLLKWCQLICIECMLQYLLNQDFSLRQNEKQWEEGSNPPSPFL